MLAGDTDNILTMLRSIRADAQTLQYRWRAVADDLIDLFERAMIVGKCDGDAFLEIGASLFRVDDLLTKCSLRVGAHVQPRVIE